MERTRRKVILVTDGDEYALRTIERVAKEIGGRCISRSHGNPTTLTGEKIVELILQTPSEPVFVMFDDSGYLGEGAGERALKYVARHPNIEVLGIIAVAAKTHQTEWARVDISIDRDGNLTSYGVDKSGIPEFDVGRINGDTVYCLDELEVPIIVGIGDIGKMARKDDIKVGSPITKKSRKPHFRKEWLLSINKKNNIPISPDIVKNDEFFKTHIGLGTGSFDIGVRKIKLLKKEVHIYFLNGLCDTEFIIQLLRELVNVNDKETNKAQVMQIVENRLVHQQVSPIKNMDEAVDNLLSGLIIIMVEGEDTALAVDVRSYPGRQPAEPDTEKVIRGARDGFVENIIVNCALIRRRIRDERIRHEIIKVGERSKTDICISYIKDVANPRLVDLIRKELQEITVDGLTMADKTIEEFLVKQGYNPYPLVRYTERPDVAANHLLEGHVIIMVDTSPSVIITPITMLHHVQHAEEYRQSPAVGTFLRWTRFLGIIVSIFLLPLWFLLVLEPSLIPEQIDYIGPNEKSNIPIVVQIFLADLGIEFLRMAAIHTPTALTTAMGLIAAALIGQIAIDVGLFTPEVILYVAVAAIGNFATPSYELGAANKIARLVLLIAVAIFKTPGFVIGCTVYFLLLASIRSLNTPYLWPFLPFNPKALWQIVIRPSVPGAKLRPSIVHPQNQVKQ